MHPTPTRPCFARLLNSILFAALLTMLGAGCGGENRVTVAGTVLVDGKPAMEGVRIYLSPVGNTRPADGFVGAEGTFSLKSMNNPGVMPGEYKVVLINSTESIPKPTSDPNFTPVNGDPPKDWFAHLAAVTKFLENPPVGPGWIPKLYANHATTPLRHTVTGGNKKVTFEVESTPVKAGAK